MATTTNYGWTTPDNTAYVKDGAAAIRSLGSSIDTTEATTNLAGLVLVRNTAITTGVASTVINTVFNSTYTNYAIEFTVTPTAGVTPVFQLRNGGTTIAGGLYRSNYQFSGSSGAFTSGVGTADNDFGVVSTTAGGTSATYSGVLNVYSPATTDRKQSHSRVVGRTTTGATAPMQGSVACFVDSTTSCDGIIISVSSGTFTGNVAVYGYRKAI